MSKFLTFTLAVLGMVASASAKDPGEPASATEGKVLRHVVLFKFKPDTKETDIEKVVDAFGLLPKKIDTIKDFEWGTDVSPEKKSAGYTHCFLVTFADAEGRDAYLPHPAHKEFVKIVGPHLDDALVVDYWSKP